MAITIKKIAELAEVSRGTVDRVLNNRGGVREEVKTKILNIIEEQNYRPNMVAKALAQKQFSQKKIGIILNSVDNPFYEEVIKGILDKEKSIRDFGFSIIMENKKGYQVLEQIKAIDNMLENNVDALIISPINDIRVVEKLNQVSQKKIPIVNVNIDVEGSERLVYIGSNYIQAGRVAASLFSLISKNKEYNVAIVTGSNLVLGHNLRIKGFKEFIKENNSNINIICIEENEDIDEISYKVTKKILENNKVNGIFFCAAGIKGGLKAIKEKELIDKLDIITVDLTPEVRKNMTKGNIVATICQEPYRQGFEATEIIFNYLMMGFEPQNKIIHTNTEIKMKDNL
ncbi:LacI family DNA-binding transcriptional regulator [Streptobacillus canis]|uniref:LacI family DNA-binding transcriptional regulator n=1 Tax=Streptobacillus canis TaxID=2678686 RepID=UPI0012E301B8|nr:LacI family DNA-binding transcriptional regulator [Streptobacillus canis]